MMKDLSARLYLPNAADPCGTAWMISNNYALTACHCLHPQCRPAFAPGTRFWLEFDSGHKLEATLEACHEQTDAALLRVLSSNIETTGKLIFARLPADEWDDYNRSRSQLGGPQWRSYGYPVAGKRLGPDRRWQGHVIGGVIRDASSRHIQLQCQEGGSPAHEAFGPALNGMSGAAVEHDNAIIGIIRSAPPLLNQRSVFATPLDEIARALPKVDRIIRENFLAAVRMVVPNLLGARDTVVAHEDSAAARIIRGRGCPLGESRPIHGRDDEVFKIKALLDNGEKRIVLTGPAGAGKSRLAVAVGEAMLDLRGGVFFADIAADHDGSAALSTIADALGIKEAHENQLEESLTTEIADKHVLVLLDNADLCMEERQLFERMQERCPNLYLVATSNGPHGWGREFRVPPLPLPAVPDGVPAQELLLQAGPMAVFRIFVESARRAKPDFTLSEHNVREVAEMCIACGGLPLAIELVAAIAANLFERAQALKFNALSIRLAEIGQAPLEERLDHVLELVTDGFSPDAQCQLWTLAAFVGGCSVEAAQTLGSEVCGASQAAARHNLDLFVQRGLLSVCKGVSEKQYYRQQPAVRDYCLAKLEASGQLPLVRRTQASFYGQLVKRAERRFTLLSTWELQNWFELLELEYDNIRMIIGWIDTNTRDVQAEPERDQDPHLIDLGLRIVGNLFWFWNLRGSLSEGVLWCNRLLSRASAFSEERGAVLYCCGGLHFLRGEFVPARDCLTESVAVWEELKSERRLGYALVILGMVALYQNQPREALWHERRAVGLFGDTGDRWGLALARHDLAIVLMALDRPWSTKARSFLLQSKTLWQELENDWGLGLVANSLGRMAFQEGHTAEANQYLLEAVTIQKQGRYRWGHAHSIAWLGRVMLAQGNYAEATSRFYESLVLHLQLGRRQMVAECMDGLAEVAAHAKQLDMAAELLGAADGLRELGGEELPPATAKIHDRLVKQVREALGTDAFAHAHTLAAALEYGDATRRALQIAIELVDAGLAGQQEAEEEEKEEASG